MVFVVVDMFVLFGFWFVYIGVCMFVSVCVSVDCRFIKQFNLNYPSYEKKNIIFIEVPSNPSVSLNLQGLH